MDYSNFILPDFNFPDISSIEIPDLPTQYVFANTQFEIIKSAK